MSDLLDRVLELIPAERIDGTSVRDAAEMVDLSIAFTPVVERGFEGYQHTISRPVEVQLWSGGRYAIVDAKNHDFRIVRVEELKVMRARYLLLRSHYTRNFRAFPHQIQQELTHYYFPDGLWLPPEGSALAKAMGIH